MSRCTPIKCNNPTPTGDLCVPCLRTVAELELMLWGDSTLGERLGDKYLEAFVKRFYGPNSSPGLPVAEGGVAEQSDEPQIVHG